ncbi:hypothetical protein GCM10027614_61640 [Micromonospora vulcania]
MAVNHPPVDRPPARSLRIAMVVPPWLSVPPPGYGGLEQVAAGLIDALTGHGHAVTLFGAGSQHGTAADGFVSTVPEVQYERLGESLPELAHLARVNRVIKAADFDVIHDHTTIGPLVAGRRAVPTVATVHGNPVGEYGDVLADADRESPWWPSRTPSAGSTRTCPGPARCTTRWTCAASHARRRPAPGRCSGWPASARTRARTSRSGRAGPPGCRCCWPESATNRPSAATTTRSSHPCSART